MSRNSLTELVFFDHITRQRLCAVDAQNVNSKNEFYSKHRSYRKDDGSPVEASDQERASNHFMWHMLIT